jgi:outer membrane receptor for ferrienterochelin and colicins
MLLAVVAWSPPARAQAPGEGDIEQMDLASMLDTPLEVWAATKTEQRSHDAPAIITTVTREQIAVWGYRSVAEVLSHLLGFYVVDDHTSPNLAVRGTSGGLHADSSIVKVLIDGHSVAFHSTGGNWLGPELVPLSAIDHIEVVRGPASALFGADAFLGVVSIVTRRGKSVSGAEASLGAGRAGRRLTTDLDLSAGFETGDIDVLIAARRNSQDLSGLSLRAPPAAPAAPYVTPAQALDQTSTSVLFRLSYQPRLDSEMGLFGYFSSIGRGAEFGSLIQLARSQSDSAAFAANRVSLSQMRAGLSWEQGLGTTLRLSMRGSVFRGGPNDDHRLEIGSEHYYVRPSFSFRGGDFETQLNWTPGWSVNRPLHLVAGASAFLDDELLPSRIGVVKEASEAANPGDVIDAITVYQGLKTFLNTGAYLQGIWEANQWLGITGGVRYDRHNVYGGQISERVGLVSNPLPVVRAKLLYGSSFKAPSPNLLYAIPSAIGDVVGNPQLRPQYGRTLELQLAWEPAEFLSLSSSAAYNVLSDKTEFVQQGINKVARNIARARTLSWESIAELSYRSLVGARLSFEVQRTVRQTGQVGYTGWVVGAEGGIYPSAMAHAGVVTQPPGSPVRAVLSASYIGDRRASDTNILLNRRPYVLAPYLLVEAALSTIPLHLFGLSRQEIWFALLGKNLTNTAGPAPGFAGVDYPLAPRTLLFTMNLRL